MKKAISGLFMGVAMAFVSLSALANSYSFDFMSSDSTYEATGVFNTSNTLNAASAYDILGITGSVLGAGGGSITGLVSNPSQPYPTTNYGFIYDNNFVLNNNGVLFTVGSGSIWNLFTEGAGFRLYTYDAEGSTGKVDQLGTMVSAPVPEPETYAMMLAGLGLMGYVARRRKQKLSA